MYTPYADTPVELAPRMPAASPSARKFPLKTPTNREKYLRRLQAAWDNRFHINHSP